MSLRNVLLFVITMPFMAFPQVPNSISGRVLDEGGLPLPGTDVTLEQANTEWKRSCKTDQDGYYHFDCLTEGVYSLMFKYPGFITERMENFTYKSPYYSTKIDRKLRIDPGIRDLFIRSPSDEPGKPLVIFVKDNRSSDNLENAQAVISDANGILNKSPTTGLCGHTYIYLEPGKRYSVRISKDGYQPRVINFDMPDEEKELEIRLNPID